MSRNMVNIIVSQLQSQYTMHQVGWELGSKLQSLNNWQKGLEEIQQGTFQYDNSMPKECIGALYKNKVELYTEIVNYLLTLELKLQWTSNKGFYKEYVDYKNKIKEIERSIM